MNGQLVSLIFKRAMMHLKSAEQDYHMENGYGDDYNRDAIHAREDLEILLAAHQIKDDTILNDLTNHDLANAVKNLKLLM